MPVNDTKYFDLHISGIGYLNRIREVSPKRSDPFWATDIAAIFGAADAIQRTRFDCLVVGSEAKRVIARMQEHVDAEKKVLAAFKLGDLYAETFQYTTGEKTGETGISLKARLLRIDWVKVGGETVYTAPKPEVHAGIDAKAMERLSTAEPGSITAETVAAVSEDQEMGDDIADDLPDEIELSRNDAKFAQKKARLKVQGYRFDGQTRTWKRPQAA